MIELITQRLAVSPMTEGELEALTEQYREAVPELGRAYQEMLDSCRKFPEQMLWFTSWKISLRESGLCVGYAGFKGFNGGYPEIGYGIDEEYEGRGFATEAVRALCTWALQAPGVFAVEAETEPDNTKSQRVLLKNGFVNTGRIGLEGPRFILWG